MSQDFTKVKHQALKVISHHIKNPTAAISAVIFIACSSVNIFLLSASFYTQESQAS